MLNEKLMVNEKLGAMEQNPQPEQTTLNHGWRHNQTVHTFFYILHFFTFYNVHSVSNQLSTSNSIFLHFTIFMATQSGFQSTFF